MQLLGILVAFGVVSLGFLEREVVGVSFFDPHALAIILLGCLGATLLSSRPDEFIKTFFHLRELLPGSSQYEKQTEKMEEERYAIEGFWLEGENQKAIDVAEKSVHPSIKMMTKILLKKSSRETIDLEFTRLSQKELDAFSPTVKNWSNMGKLAPSFGMVGTLTGMIQLFKNFGSQSTQIGTGLSLALLATLYGIAFGAAVAGPIGHYFGNLLDRRLDILERCEKTSFRLARS